MANIWASGIIRSPDELARREFEPTSSLFYIFSAPCMFLFTFIILHPSLFLFCTSIERRYIEVTREELGPEDNKPAPVPLERPPRKVYPSIPAEDSVAEVMYIYIYYARVV